MRLTPAGAANLAYELQKEALALETAAAEKRAEAQRVLEMATSTSEAADDDRSDAGGGPFSDRRRFEAMSDAGRQQLQEAVHGINDAGEEAVRSKGKGKGKGKT